MNYELAKQLFKNGTFKSSVPVTKTNEKYLEYPRLSELIEACGEGINIRLQSYWSKNDLMWQADDWGNFLIPEKVINAGVGSTPEEAVANLWLALNNK